METQPVTSQGRAANQRQDPVDVDGAPLPATGATLFPELVVAHHRWLVSSWPYRWPPDVLPAYTLQGWKSNPSTIEADGARQLRQKYRERLREFETLEGKIIRAYWCFRAPSGVVLTERSVGDQTGLKGRLRRFRRSKAEIHLHRASDWLTARVPAITELLHHCDALAVKVNEVLSGTARRIALEWIFEQESYLLGLVEQGLKDDEVRRGEIAASADGHARRGRLRRWRRNAAPTAARLTPAAAKPLAVASSEDPLVKAAADEVVRIEAYYDRAATRSGNMIYFAGMALGALVVGVVAVLAAIGLSLTRRGDINIGDFVAAFAAGAIGALVSVMVRMGTGNFRADYEVGRDKLLVLGFVRPAIGAIFGLAVYFALRGNLLQLAPQANASEGDGGNFYFYAFLAFLAGFSERWTHIILGGAQRTIESALGRGDESGEHEDTAAERRSRRGPVLTARVPDSR